MIKKSLIILFLLITTQSICAQSKDIEFKVDKEEKALLITGYNNTTEPLEITLTIKDIKLLKGYAKPITKVVAAMSSAQFVKLTFEYDFYKYKLSYSFKKLPTEAEKKMNSYKKEDHYLKDASKINEGIVIFDDEGCGRCDVVTNYLVAHDIPFKVIDLSKGEENTKLMWSTIKEKGASMKVKAPVIIVNGELSHSHTDLKQFLEGLKQ